MVAINVTDRSGEVHTLQVAPGSGLMEVLRDHNFGIDAICGGCCSCATCHVFIPPKWAARVSVRSADENDLALASTSYRPEQSRLSCQIRISEDLDGLEVTVAPAD